MDVSPASPDNLAMLARMGEVILVGLIGFVGVTLRSALKELQQFSTEFLKLKQAIYGPPNGVIADCDELRDRTHDLGNIIGSHKFRLWNLEEKAGVDSPPESELRWGTK